MKTLHLNLKKKWFDMILSGEKKEEYRALKQYWNLRLGMDDRIEYPELYDFKTITFSNGYAKNRRQFIIKLGGIDIGTGLPKWGAVKHKKYFVLRLGEIIKSSYTTLNLNCKKSEDGKHLYDHRKCIFCNKPRY